MCDDTACQNGAFGGWVSVSVCVCVCVERGWGQPRPQGFSFKKPFFEGKALGTRWVGGGGGDLCGSSNK